MIFRVRAGVVQRRNVFADVVVLVVSLDVVEEGVRVRHHKSHTIPVPRLHVVVKFVHVD